jgi:hypothetical protein
MVLWFFSKGLVAVFRLGLRGGVSSVPHMSYWISKFEALFSLSGLADFTDNFIVST